MYKKMLVKRHAYKIPGWFFALNLNRHKIQGGGGNYPLKIETSKYRERYFFKIWKA